MTNRGSKVSHSWQRPAVQPMRTDLQLGKGAGAAAVCLEVCHSCFQPFHLGLQLCRLPHRAGGERIPLIS